MGEEAKDILDQYFEGKIPMVTQVCKVKAVDKAVGTCTCIPLNDDAELTDVRLSALNKLPDNPFVLFPKVGSTVIVVFIEKSDYAFVAEFTDVEGWKVKIGGFDMEVNEATGKLIMNSGNLGGLIKIVELVGGLKTITDDIGQLKQLLAGAVPVSADGGAAIKSALTPWYSANLSTITKSQIEDQNIQH